MPGPPREAAPALELDHEVAEAHRAGILGRAGEVAGQHRDVAIARAEQRRDLDRRRPVRGRRDERDGVGRGAGEPDGQCLAGARTDRPEVQLHVTLVAAQVARPQRAVGDRRRAHGPGCQLRRPDGAGGEPPDRTARRAMAAGPTALGRSFAAVTERLAGVLSVRRVRAERSFAARLPSRILAPVTELPTRREPAIFSAASWAAAGPPSATNRATDDSTSAADGRRMGHLQQGRRCRELSTCVARAAMQGSAGERDHCVSSGRRPSRERRLRPGQDARQGRGADAGGGRPGRAAGGVPRSLRRRVPARLGVRRRRREPHRRGSRGVPALLGRRCRRSGTCRRGAGPGSRRRAASSSSWASSSATAGRSTCTSPRSSTTTGAYPGQAPQAHADRLRCAWCPGFGDGSTLPVFQTRRSASWARSISLGARSTPLLAHGAGTRKGSRIYGAPDRRTRARPGSPRSATSPSRGGASCRPPTSSRAAATTRRTIRCRETIPTPSSAPAAA